MQRMRTLAALAIILCPSVLVAGTISGKVSYSGTAPKARTIDMSQEPVCAQQHASPLPAETVVTGTNQGLANVVVYVSAGARDENQAPAQAVVFDQKGCQYVPHVLVIQVGQEVRVMNSDQTSHNVHPVAKLNHEWNKSQPPGAKPIVESYDKEEFIPVKCNVHPWMRGYFVVLKTSHYDVSREDGGFKLPNLPPGKYTITAWHEVFGTRTAEVTIGGSETKSVTFTFETKGH